MVYNLKMAEVNDLKHPYVSEHDFVQRIQSDGLWLPEVDYAFEESQRIHRDQVRDSGQPFLTEHIFPVTVDALDLIQGWFASKQKYSRGSYPRDNAIEKAKQRQIQVVSAALLHDAAEYDPGFESKDHNGQIDHEVLIWLQSLTKVSRLNGNGNKPVDGVYEIDSEGIYVAKIRNANKYPQAIKILERINNTRSSITNAAKLPAKLRKYNWENEIYYLRVAEQLRDEALYERLDNVIELGRLAYDQVARTA
jgi:(p)ppGpp synthase/HD superfamily hydrolase